MKQRLRGLWRTAGLAAALGALPALAAGPTDNLRATYRNDVEAAPYTNAAGQVAVQLGVGSGYYFTTNRTIRYLRFGQNNQTTYPTLETLQVGLRSVFPTPVLRSTIGQPIAGATANKSLGEKLTPPADWDGTAPDIDEGTGGLAVWIDFAKAVIACEAGPVTIRWPLKGGSEKTETAVIAASPNKRPVRLYWTHERPASLTDNTYKSLQNAGPTVSFGQNYKVHLYPTSRVRVFDPKNAQLAYDRNDGQGYVCLNGNELQAFEGTYGTFLVVYSRLDETLNERKMLAYELVEVLEPKQTQIDVKIGDQLKPQTRDFATNELFPRVTRGLTDESENGEVYVYQHGTGAQKNYLWAIRDSSANPWKIEVFWRAKEELDVVWPFEVDIYAASWDAAGAQPYLRDTENARGGAAKTQPVVYCPSGLAVEAMDYQVVADGSGTKEQKHFHVADGLFYSDWADAATYALLKYTSGDAVWFQTVRSIPAKAEATLAALSLDFEGVCTNVAYRTGAATNVVGALDVSQQVALAAEIRAPFAGADGFFYPGWIRRDHEPSADAFPVRNPYNVNLYAYPTAYVAPDEAVAPIFPVNLGELEVWWSLPSTLMGAARPNGGNADPLAAPIYFPSIPVTYTVHTPEQIARLSKDEGASLPQIVIASGYGSAGESLDEHLSRWERQSARAISCNTDQTTPGDAAVKLKLSGLGNPGGVTSNFTFEARLLCTPQMGGDTYDERPIISFYRGLEDGSPDKEAYLRLGFNVAGHLLLNGADVLVDNYLDADGNPSKDFPSAFSEFGLQPTEAQGAHLVFRHEGTTWSFFLNGHFVGTCEGEAALDIARDHAKIFEVAASGSKYRGPVHYLRLWSVARSAKEIDQNRYAACAPSASLVFQYDGPTQPFETNGEEDAVEGTIKDGYLVDSSGHDARGYLDYPAEVVTGGGAVTNDTAYWMQAGACGGVELRLPQPGRTFPNDAIIYRQPDPAQDGYNPNEEHALLVGGVAHALRCDLNRLAKDGEGDAAFTSLPYVLVQYVDADTRRPAMCALRVVPESDLYRFRRYLTAGSMVQSPDPLARLQPANLQKFISGPLYGGTETCFRDRKGWFWAHQAGDDGGSTNYVFELSYPNQPAFDYPDGSAPEVGAQIPWMAGYVQRDDSYVWTMETGGTSESPFPRRPDSDPVGTAIDYTYVVDWPVDAPGLYVNDTLHGAKDGLPAVRGQLSAKVLYQQSVATGGVAAVRLIDPETRQGGKLIEIPDDIRNYRDPKTAKRKFTDLPPLLRDRFQWNPTAFHDMTHNDSRELELTGQFIDEGAYQFALLNAMDARSKAVMLDPDLLPGAEAADWVAGVESVASEPIVVADDVTPFTALALATTGKGAGYVTLVFNDSTNLSMVAKSEVVSMAVIRVVPELYNGDLHVFQSDNPLDKQLNLKYTSDFGAKPEAWEFDWQYCEPQGGSAAPADSSAWLTLAGSCGKPGVPMLDWITVGDAGVFGLSDHYVRCRYRALDPAVQAVVGAGWSTWSAPKLAEGWVKRVLKAINPFDQKIRDFLNNKVDLSLSAIQQAGAPYQGDIPLNLEALGENGLIAIYETLLNQAKKLSVDADYLATDSLALSLQMAAGRIAELYLVLGNEAYADALNPTVDLGGDARVDDTAEASVFPFMNQCENLLDEELCLLRGRDLSKAYAESWNANVEPSEYPYYNRLPWNFTADILGGQVAYVENYGIRDVCGASDAADPSAKDGVIDVYDAKALYPQGHGDAWGHYLSAEKGYYALLRHPNFGWKPQIEGILAGQTEITIGYLHEKRFAQVAEMKAKTGERIVAATQRSRYVAGEADRWLDAEDDDEARAWGVDEWATRAHLGAYYDWATVNALLPARTAEEGLVRMLDRESTKELGAVAASARRIQATADASDKGLNPLGLSDNAVPFDISPTEIDAGKTHFEQILDRAKKATQVAREVFLRAKAASNALRDQNASADYEKLVSDEEAAIERRLIEIYGYPYDDDIGPGKTYPQGYAGPDIYHYSYVETYDLDGSGGINGAYRGVSEGDGSYGRYVDVTVDDYRLITTNITGTFQAEIDTSLADNGFFGNIIVGAVSWYQDKLGQLGGYIDPWSKYTGIASSDFALPVAIVDTAGDALDGKVDYTFAVAAWTNAPWVASYYVGEGGFTPKPKDFHGQRKAEGETQIALNGYARQLAEIDVKANALFAANEKLQGLIDELTSLDYTTQMGYVTDAAKKEVENYTAACKKNAETVEKTLTALKELKDTLTESGVEAFPKLTGLSFDLTSAGRAALLAVKSGVNDALNGQLAAQSEKVDACEDAVAELEDALTKQFAAWMDNADRQKKVAAIKEQTAKVRGALAELEVAFVNANETRMGFAKVVVEGDELQAERERLRIQWAADLSQSRYRNMTYQIFRNDALQRYHEAFELAAKYVFLAAKAYDYETGLLQSDKANTAGSAFMTSIVRARALGRFASDGTPLVGSDAGGDPGLADVLARMEQNWGVLKTRLGFNNMQGDLDSFSLRADLFGKAAGTAGDKAWRDALAACWVDDLRTHPVFARLCQPFSPMKAQEPGFAIPFRTVIAARKDLFGNDLAGGSTAYSSTYFATKLRAVGVWIEGASAASALPKRPEVYLVPSGLDSMRAPIRASANAAAIRSWQVVDQVLPVPYSLAESDWEADDWSMLKDVFGNEMALQRRHPAIRANVGAAFDEAATLTYNARLVGRSVWNDQWYVFIPAASLNADDAAAKAAFLESVRDIHLSLRTYSMSGN